MEEEPKFSDWEIKRIRYRLLVYLYYLNLAFDSRTKSKHASQTTEAGGAGRVAASRPSWETIAIEINDTYECQKWVNFEEYEPGQYRPIDLKSVTQGTKLLKTTAITYNKLFLMVKGEPDKRFKKSELQKFNTPNGYSLMGIVQFLKVRGFLSDTDLNETSARLPRSEAISQFKNFRLEPTVLHENKFFNGDYVSESYENAGGSYFKTMHIHTETERSYNFREKQYQHPELYKTKIVDRRFLSGVSNYNSIFDYNTAWGVFRPQKYAAFLFCNSNKYRSELYIALSNIVHIDATKIAAEYVKETRKVLTLEDQIQCFSYAQYVLPSETLDCSLKECGTKDELKLLSERIQGSEYKTVFSKLLEKNL